MILGQHRLPVNAACVADIVDALRSVRVSTLSFRGCSLCEVYVDLENTEVLMMQTWNEAEHLKAYVKSDLYFRVLSLLDLAAGIPTVRFFEVQEMFGLGFVEDLRREHF